MKKSALAFLILTVLSCQKQPIVPIEKHKGLNYVVTDITNTIDNNFNLQLKSKDTIFWVTVLNFDGNSVKVGDTLK